MEKKELKSVELTEEEKKNYSDCDKQLNNLDNVIIESTQRLYKTEQTIKDSIQKKTEIIADQNDYFAKLLAKYGITPEMVVDFDLKLGILKYDESRKIPEPEIIKHKITQEDLDINPELAEAGVKVGEEVELPVVEPTEQMLKDAEADLNEQK